jgi:glycosyltransferase involved in cell wall biosynthesis
MMRRIIGKEKPLFSILVPFRPDHSSRDHNWKWLKKYWKHVFGDTAEVVMGYDYWQPFSKTSALNNAARKAKTDIFVMIDADAYIDPMVIYRAVVRIKHSERKGHPLWFVPYRRVYRLTPEASDRVVGDDCRLVFDQYQWPNPKIPLEDPPPAEDVENLSTAHYGHRYGALLQIMSRRAFYSVGGMDCRFRGWGGEDVSFMRAVDTLYGKHKTFNEPIYHLAHYKIGDSYFTRKWSKQGKALPNGNLALRYHRAFGDKRKMRDLVNEGFAHCRKPKFFDRLIEGFRCVRFW